MANFNGKFESAKQQWTTPDDLFDKLNDEFQFDTDLAADASNTKCPKYFDKELDGLLQDWSGRCWLNPTYGDKNHKLVDWVKKSYYSAESGNCQIVMLIPARTNTKWWHDFCMKAKEIRFICGRPKFGGATHGLPQPLALIIFDKHEGETKYSSFVI